MPAITIAYGDGFGSAVMEAALTVLREAGAKLTIETIEIGGRIYSMGSKTGILPSAWKVLEKNRVLLKAPVIVPEGCRETGEVIREYFGLNENSSPHRGEDGRGALDAMPDNAPSLTLPLWGRELSAQYFINENFALFEPIYSDECWQKKPATLDPSPMIHAAIAMLTHIDQQKTADNISRALSKTLEENLHLKERKRLSRMTEAVIERLGKN